MLKKIFSLPVMTPIILLILSQIPIFPIPNPFSSTDQQKNSSLSGINAAYLEYTQGNYNKACSYFPLIEVTGKLKSIEDYIDYWWAKSLWITYRNTDNKTNKKKALDLFLKVANTPGSPWKKKALHDYLLTLYHIQDTENRKLILDVLNRFPSEINTDSPQILYILGDTYRLENNNKKSDEYFIRLWKSYPDTSWARRTEREFKESGKLSKLDYPAIRAEELLNIYNKHLGNNKSTSTLDNLLKRMNSLKPHTMNTRLWRKWNLVYGKIFWLKEGMKKRNKALNYFYKAYNTSDYDVKTEAAFQLIRIYGEDFVFSRIKTISDGINTKYCRKGSFFSRAIYSAGFPFIRKQQFKQAIHFYSILANDEKNPYYDQALWRLQWCYYHLKNYKQVFIILDKLSKLEKWIEYSEFWYALVLQKSGEKEKAKEKFLEVINKYAFTYYGVRSKEILENEYGVSVDLESNKPPFREIPAMRIDNTVRANRFDILKELHLYEFAAIELETYLRERNLHPWTYKDTWRPFGLELAKLHFQSKKYLKAEVAIFEVYRDELSEGFKDMPQWFREIYYPLLYKDSIDTYSNTYKMDPLLVYSLIRQESGFDPAVVSGSGAIGIMQIMPQTGQDIFTEMGPLPGTQSYSADMLHNPLYNIPMGIYHLRNQLYKPIERILHDEKKEKTNNTHLKNILMIAGYNAGITAANRWITEIPFESDDEFIDQIDYTETRRYVKLILKHRFFYQKIIDSLQK